jgi:hypothetical protein
MFGSDRLYTKFNFYLDELEVISVPHRVRQVSRTSAIAPFSVDSESRRGLKDTVGQLHVVSDQSALKLGCRGSRIRATMPPIQPRFSIPNASPSPTVTRRQGEAFGNKHLGSANRLIARMLTLVPRYRFANAPTRFLFGKSDPFRIRQQYL